MYHSVYFGNMNSFSDWHLVPDGRPVIALPELKEVTVDIPGGQGTMDLSEALTNYPLYGNRSGSLVFNVLNGYGDWAERYQTIANYLHGHKIDIWLEDDPEWVYRGRCKVAWESPNDGTWSKVTIDYVLEPFKYNKTPISITETLAAGTSSKATTILQSERSYPIIPTVNITSNSTTGLIFYVVNNELSLTRANTAMTAITTTGSRKLYSCVLSNISGSNNCKLYSTRTSGTTGSANYTITYDRVML